MKIVLIAATGLAAALLAAPAFAQNVSINTQPNTGFYGTLGYTDRSADGADLSGITGRVGDRLFNYFGVEGEATFGVGDDNGLHLDNRAGVFGVGYLPIAPNIDLFARAGWSETQLSFHGSGFSAQGNDNGFSYGAGGQWFWDGKNGVRGDWTRDDYGHDQADVWGVSYIRKF
jgi:hypothetical protein